MPPIPRYPYFGRQLGYQPYGPPRFPFQTQLAQRALGLPGGGGGDAGLQGQAWPDLATILAQDPFFQQFKAGLGAQGVQDEATRRAAIQRALIQFGEIPESILQGGQQLTGPVLSVLDETTRSLAQQNTQAGLSTMARIEQARQDQARAVERHLASRGLLRSGETGFLTQRAHTDFLRLQSDARQQLLDYLAGVQSAFLQSERARQQQTWQAMLEALLRSGQQGPPGGAAPPPAAPGAAGPVLRSAFQPSQRYGGGGRVFAI